MRPMNPTGDPRSYHGWSVGRPMNSLCFAKNISEEKWTDNSADALITYNNNNNNNGPNGHLFYVGGDLMMRRGMLPIIMLPDGDLRGGRGTYPWFSTRLQYLHCLHTENTTVLHETIGKSVCTWVWIKREYRLAHFDQFFNWFHGLSILLTDHPKLRRTTQSSIMSGPLGDPGFCFFRSTGIGSVIQNWCR